MNKKNIFAQPLYVVLILVIGIVIGSKLNNNGLDFKYFSSNYDSKSKIIDILNYIQRDYVDTINVEEITENTIDKLLENLDPHSRYLSASHFSIVSDEMNGNFFGIGVQFRVYRDTITVIQVVKSGPSEKAGILAGDRIIAVDGEPYFGAKISNIDVTKKLKGKQNSKVELTIFRSIANKKMKFTITRDAIPTYSIDCAYMINSTTAYIKLNSFTATSADEFREASKRLLGQGMKNLILDLRNNGGGLLSTCIAIADEFLDNEQLIVYTKGRNRKPIYHNSTKGGLLVNCKSVVLINESSASASEILAGALQDHDKATIIGRRSFGKGLVQEEIELEDGSALLLTVSRYYTPLGRCIQKSYESGGENYEMDIMVRYKHGELMHQDSIQQADTTKYITAKGNVLYGGGGITPSIFIPIDTMLLFGSYNREVNAFQLSDFVFKYTDKYRLKLNTFTDYSDFNNRFFADNNLTSELFDYAKSEGIYINQKLFSLQKLRIMNEVKALIAQNLFGEEFYYQISNKMEVGTQKALNFLNK